MRLISKLKYFIYDVVGEIRWALRRRFWSIRKKERNSYLMYLYGCRYEHVNRLIWGKKLTYDEYIKHIDNYKKSIGF